MKRLLPLVLAAPLAALSCGPRGGPDVGNGATVSFDLSGYEAPVPTGTASPGQQAIVLRSGVHVDEVWVAVEKFHLVEATVCDDGADEETDFEGPIIANLVDQTPGTSSPVAIVPGSYCRLELELHEVAADELPAGAPAELAGAALFIRGTRSDGRPFTVRSKQKVDFRLEASDAPIPISGDNPLIVGIELGAMMTALDLGTLTDDPIVIDETTNPDRLAALEQALREAARLFRDDDDDGTLSDTEAAEGKEIAEGKP
jgi:hypothetical protein